MSESRKCSLWPTIAQQNKAMELLLNRNRTKHKHEYLEKGLTVSGYGRSQYRLEFCKCGHMKSTQELSVDGDWLISPTTSTGE